MKFARETHGAVSRIIGSVNAIRWLAVFVILPLAGLLLVNESGAAEEDFPAGRIIDRVECRSDRSRTYALYLPSRYDPKEKYPALLVFDPRGRGRLAAEQFLDGADRRSWLVLSSNETRSDGPMEPNLRALRALWPELSRYAVDERRIYVAGFSGGAILAWTLALDANGRIAGVIASGGRLPDEIPAPDRVPFVYFGAAGRRDFNHSKMADIDLLLGRLGSPHRFETFEGSHEWMPKEMAAEAIDWMELIAMKEGLAPCGEIFVEEEWGRERSGARELENSGHVPSALRRYESMVRSFEGLRDSDEAKQKIRALNSTAAVLKSRQEEREAGELEREFEAVLGRALRNLWNPEMPMPAARLASELRIDELILKAKSGGAAGDAARRILERIFTQLSFYQFRDMAEKKRWGLAASALTVALRIHEHDAATWYDLACSYARVWSPFKAIDALGHAVDDGFLDRDHLAKDPDLDTLRDLPGYRDVVRRMKTGS